MHKVDIISARIMAKYVKFKKGYQARFLREIKEKCFRNWEEVADFLDVGRSMVFFYLKEKSKLRHSKFLSLIEKAKLDACDFHFELIQYPCNGEGEIPECLNEYVAEFFGIMLGDGCICKRNYQMVISCGLIDNKYIREFVPSLVWNLFAKIPTIKTLTGLGTGINCYFSSKIVSDYLINQLDFPLGKKTQGNLQIPEIFYESRSLLNSCIRGLFDTDGGVHRHHKNSIQLKFTNKSESLIESLKNALITLNFNPIISFNKKREIYDIYLFTEEVKKYFDDIGSHNPKNNIKYQKWLETGIMPLNSEIRV